jgi:two-component system NtrC family sensor kinase
MPRPLRVLILEDRPEDCDLMLHELRREGFEPAWQRVESEASYVARLTPDLDVILADYSLPGFDAVRALHRLKDRGLDVPFIVLSGTIGDERAAAIMRDGATDYLLKDRLARLGPAVTAAVAAARQRRAFREVETRYKSLFERVPVGLYRSTPAGEIVDWNPALVQMLGYPDRQSFLTANATDFYVDPGQRSRFQALIAEQGSARGFETQFRRRDGSVLSVRLSGSRVQDAEGRTLYYEGSIEDVTDLKRAEAALRQSEKLAALGSLLAGVAHELNNPLSVILGHSQLLAQTVQGRTAERATKITAAAERCARIVRNFLALARQHPPERQGAALGEIVGEAVELLAYQLRLSDVEVTLELAADLPVLWADPHQLHQVFVNLIANAHHALSQAPPPRRLTIAARHDPSRAAVTIEVADTGPGMPPEVRSRIFEPFFTTKPPGQGTGLGLPLCQGIVEGHGGTIAVESAPGRGTAFRIELPVTPPPEAAPAAPPAAAAQPVRQKSILIVDDEPDVAAILADLLAVDGHRVEIAPNGARALEKLHTEAFDAILSDLRMPELDGASFYRTLAHHGHPLVQRFIFVTGDVLGEETRQFLEETGALCVGKPFDLEQVRRALDIAFRRRAG